MVLTSMILGVIKKNIEYDSPLLSHENFNNNLQVANHFRHMVPFDQQ